MEKGNLKDRSTKTQVTEDNLTEVLTSIKGTKYQTNENKFWVKQHITN